VKEKNKVFGPRGPETMNDFAGEGQQQFTQPTDIDWPVIED
jgi:hypothetical protein